MSAGEQDRRRPGRRRRARSRRAASGRSRSWRGRRRSRRGSRRAATRLLPRLRRLVGVVAQPGEDRAGRGERRSTSRSHHSRSSERWPWFRPARSRPSSLVRTRPRRAALPRRSTPPGRTGRRRAAVRGPLAARPDPRSAAPARSRSAWIAALRRAATSSGIRLQVRVPVAPARASRSGRRGRRRSTSRSRSAAAARCARRSW